MNPMPFLLHALSPVHPGTGQGVGVIDLPIARLKGTGIPYLPGSSIKGVVRDAWANKDADFLAAFGPDPDERKPENQYAGALAFGDARLLLLPVRSLRGTFAWATSSMLLRLARQDDAKLPKSPDVSGAATAIVTNGSPLVTARNKVFLEDIDLDSPADDARRTEVTEVAKYLSKWLFSGTEDDQFVKRVCIVDDETMTFLWETATQIDARNRIGPDGVVADGQLWWEESLPAETVLLGVVSATVSRSPHVSKEAAKFLETYVSKTSVCQFGGKATVGRGRMRMIPK